jgi:ATP-dependent helicase HrpA
VDSKLTDKSLGQQIDRCMIRDVHRLRRRLQNLKRARDQFRQKGHTGDDEHAEDHGARLAQLNKDIQRSLATAEQRRAGVPAINYPDNLPIAQKADEIKQVIQNNQVTILCGETGSGKTTQLPKICLDIGLGIRGKIGHTQPRRLAARSVSQRIADELGCELGKQVGFKVRFSDRSDDSSYIKLMTDGILLAECHHDPYLNQYDTIIVDEAHERSLNIDFLLGYLHRLIKKRKDLKIIITSATIDPERFSKHFSDAPIINVSGRTYPVEVLYRPYRDSDVEGNKELPDAIVDAVFELSKIGRGDILVFLSGERDIREAADALAAVSNHRLMAQTEVLPLLARLSNAEQNRIFQPSAKRKIVLATNVAETSLTVPGIRYVIDSGVARISRYSWRSKIQRLPIEKVSQASANQRMGRCGRVAEGVCIRLYDEEDFEQRDLFTEPEIKRTNLAAVILQMESLGLGHVDDFPFVEPPEERLINDGYRLLYELGAIDEKSNLTRTGRQIARLPIDPRLARMLVHAEKEHALEEVLIIVSALAVQDVRDRPVDRQQAADEKHAAFADKDSDFVFYINLWRTYHEQKQALTNNQLRKWCRNNFIAWLRMREWIDTCGQIRNMLKEQKLKFNTSPAGYDAIHRSLMSGLLSNIGKKDEDRKFLGARNRKYMVFPGSKLFRKPPLWMVSAEIVETSQVYARTNAKIDVAWVEGLAKHQMKYHYADPHWEKKRAAVVASEQSSLYGLIINPSKKVNYARIDPVVSQRIFIHDALIHGDFDCRAKFFVHNQSLMKQIEQQQAKARRQDVLVDDAVLYDFYHQRLPEHVVGGASLDKWLRQNPDKDKDLYLSLDLLTREDATQVSESQFPDALDINGTLFPLEYHFDPRNHCDGITLVSPLAAINAVDAQRCEWLIPGLIEEKVTALIRSLPKQLRKNFVPAPDFARACLEAFTEAFHNDESLMYTSLTTALGNQLRIMTGVQVPIETWNLDNIPQYLLMNFRVIDAQGYIVAEGRNLQQIKDELADEVSAAGLATSWPSPAEQESGAAEDGREQYHKDDVGVEGLAELGEPVDIDMQGITMKAYPALVCDDDQVNLRVLESQASADAETVKALRFLFSKALREQVRYISSLPQLKSLCMKYTEFGRCEDLRQRITGRVIDELFLSEPIHDKDDFEARLQAGRSSMVEKAESLCDLLSDALDAYRDVKKKIKKPAMNQLDTVADIQNQLAGLFPKGFVDSIELQWLQQYPRYLKAIDKRFEKAATDHLRDRKLRLSFADLWDEYSKRRKKLEQEHIQSDELEHYRWMLEEYRVSLFAQELGTKFPVSEKRLKKYWNEMKES